MAHRDDILSLDSRDDLATMAEIIGDITRERRLEILDDADTRWRLERAVERSQARERAQGKAVLAAYRECPPWRRRTSRAHAPAVVVTRSARRCASSSAASSAASSPCRCRMPETSA